MKYSFFFTHTFWGPPFCFLLSSIIVSTAPSSRFHLIWRELPYTLGYVLLQIHLLAFISNPALYLSGFNSSRPGLNWFLAPQTNSLWLAWIGPDWLDLGHMPISRAIAQLGNVMLGGARPGWQAPLLSRLAMSLCCCSIRTLEWRGGSVFQKDDRRQLWKWRGWILGSQLTDSFITLWKLSEWTILQKSVCKNFGYNIQVFRFKP